MQSTLNAPALFDLSGQVAFVTGAGSGIGQRIAQGFAQVGANVACLDRREDDGLQETQALIEAAGRKAILVTADVTDKSAVHGGGRANRTGSGALGRGLERGRDRQRQPGRGDGADQWQTMIDINLTGLFLSCQAEANAMLAHGRGSIVNVASMSGVIVNRGLKQVHYNTSKAGVIHLTKSMAMEWVDRGIRVNSISPGLHGDADEHPAGDGAPDQALRGADADGPHGLGRRDGRTGDLPGLRCRLLLHRRRPLGRWRILLLVVSVQRLGDPVLEMRNGPVEEWREGAGLVG